MKTFLQLTEENTKSLAMLFGRMNPPTQGHEENVEGLKRLADKNNADHLVIASHSHDANKNPLDAQTKLKHLRRAFPGTNVTTSSKEKPTIMHHAADAHARGYNHLIVVGGGDRVEEYKHLLNKYNGVEGRHGYYKFDKIEVKSTGERKAGISGTDMRNHVKNNNFEKFKQHLPTAIQSNPAHTRELFKDVRKGMNVNEQNMFKAIFITGGPNSGKDIIIRECIGQNRLTELNTAQALQSLFKTAGIKEAKERKSIIINGPAEDVDKISIVKEYLENLGYSTMMVFVETTDETSQERNTKLSRSIVESVRRDKWNIAQQNKCIFSEAFDNFMVFDNSGSFESIEEDITKTYQSINKFLQSKDYTKSAIMWLESHNKLNINDKFNFFLKETKNVQGNSKLVQKLNVKGQYNPFFRAASPADANPDNRKLDTEIDSIQGNIRPRKDPNGRGHSGGSWSGAYNTEENNPTLKISPIPKEPNFQKDADKEKVKKRGDKSTSAARLGDPSGIGSTWNTRTNGSGLTGGAGLGDQTFSEDVTGNYDVINFGAIPRVVNVNPLQSGDSKKDFKKFRKTIKEYNSFQNDDEGMGVGGTLGGATNKEPMQSYKDADRNIGITIKKKKVTKNVR